MTEPKLAAGRNSGDTRLAVWVKPRASRSTLLGWRADALEIAVAAPPVDGKANEELVRTLAAALGLRRSALDVVAGEHARQKTIVICGCAPADVRTRIAAALGVVRGERTRKGPS